MPRDKPNKTEPKLQTHPRAQAWKIKVLPVF